MIEATIEPAAGHDHPTPAAALLFEPGAPIVIIDPNAPDPDAMGDPAPDPAGVQRSAPAARSLQADPPADAGAGPLDAAPPDPAAQNRRLLTLIATGSSVDHPGGQPARIESRRYGPPAADGSPVLSQLLYLEGGRIVIDNAAGTLDVPGAGKLVVADRRTPEAERPAAPSPLAGGSARGDALFNWQGSLHVERETGLMTMSHAVEMIHSRAGDGMVTQLTAPVLTARAPGGPEGGTAAPGSAGDGAGRLQSVHAEGGVWVKSGEQEITAHTIDYDADTGILTAHTPGGVVRVTQGANIWNAAAIRWDMHAGRIEIIDPPGSVSPR
jgi:hypothetical protein